MKRMMKKLKKFTYSVMNLALMACLILSAVQYSRTKNGIYLLFSCLLIFPYLSTLSYLIRNRKKKSKKRNVKRKKVSKSKKLKKTVKTKQPKQKEKQEQESPEQIFTEFVPKNAKLPTKHFDTMEGFEFEHYCGLLLKKNGFVNVQVTQESGDQGIDIIAYKDGIKYGIQCKCYSQNIGNKSVQEAYAGKSFYNCHVGAVFTNRYFTKSAKELATRNQILLWDRDQLEQFIRNAK